VKYLDKSFSVPVKGGDNYEKIFGHSGPKIVDKFNNPTKLSSQQKNELYRKARDLKEQIAKGMCSIRETKQPTEKNINKMLNSEFKLGNKMIEFRKSMEAIGADPKDYETERLRRRS
jgi:hypothetical protein